MRLPPLTHVGDLPVGVHRAPLQEVLDRFGAGSLQPYGRGGAVRSSLPHSPRHRATGPVCGLWLLPHRQTGTERCGRVPADAGRRRCLPAPRPGGTAFRSRGGRCSLWLQRILAASLGSFGWRANHDRILAGHAWRWSTPHRRDRRGEVRIRNDEEMEATLERIRHFQAQFAHLRKVETNPVNYRLSAAGFLAEIDRMQLEVREYLSLHPVDAASSV